MKLFLAGADVQEHIEIISISDHPYFLTSYYSHRKKFLPKWIEEYNKLKKGSWIMDSGLFTMMFGAGSGKEYKEEDLVEYTYKYINDIKEINYNHYIVEMDVHKIFGLESLKRFRHIFKQKYDIEKTIYVWHIEEGEEGFIKLCKTYPYIAISIPELRIVLKGKNNLEKMVKKLILLANKINSNIKIHLLGCTQQNLMEQKGYYSCDSTSWMSGARYGTASFFNGLKLQQLHIRSELWLNYKETKRKEFESKIKRIENRDYFFNMYCTAKAYHYLNVYINNKYYNNEQIKSIL